MDSVLKTLDIHSHRSRVGNSFYLLSFSLNIRKIAPYVHLQNIDTYSAPLIAIDNINTVREYVYIIHYVKHNVQNIARNKLSLLSCKT